MSKIVDLGRLTKGRVKLLSGHPRGVEARKLFEMDSLDDEAAPVVIKAPSELEAITTSFVQGLFGNIIRKFGTDEEFFRHYKFDMSLELATDISDGIKRLRIDRKLARGE